MTPIGSHVAAIAAIGCLSYNPESCTTATVATVAQQRTITVLDPFCGTGSLLIAAAHLGTTIGLLESLS